MLPCRAWLAKSRLSDTLCAFNFKVSRMMRKFCLILPLLVLSLLVPSARADLKSDVSDILADRSLSRSEVGVEIIRLGDAVGSSVILFQHDADRLLIPASNLKIVTTSAILDRLGGDFQFHTLLVRHGDDLILIGDGDPSLGDPEFLHHGETDTTALFVNWAQSLKSRGITRVGNLLVDDSVFDEHFFHPNWPPEQADKRYAAEIAGVSFDTNCIQCQVRPNSGLAAYTLNPNTHFVNVRNTCLSGGSNDTLFGRNAGTNDLILRGTCPVANQVSVTIHNPPLYAATVLAETLAAAGIQVTGKVASDRTVRAALCSHASAHDPTWSLLCVQATPLPAVMARCNKDSMNMYAESFCKRLGFAVSGKPGSWENGTAAVGAFLAHVGIDPQLYHLDDGCGLSKQNAIAAHALAMVLTYDFFSKNHQAFFDSLSRAGSDGTLAKRFEGSDLRGRVFGKTGWVEGVSALSGYLHAKDGRWYVFSILVNGNSKVKPLEDAIVAAIDRMH